MRRNEDDLSDPVICKMTTLSSLTGRCLGTLAGNRFGSIELFVVLVSDHYDQTPEFAFPKRHLERIKLACTVEASKFAEYA